MSRLRRRWRGTLPGFILGRSDRGKLQIPSSKSQKAPITKFQIASSPRPSPPVEERETIMGVHGWKADASDDAVFYTFRRQTAVGRCCGWVLPARDVRHSRGPGFRERFGSRPFPPRCGRGFCRRRWPDDSRSCL